MLVSEPFIKACRFQSGVDYYFCIAEFCNPLFSFCDRSAAEMLSSIFGKNNDLSDQNRIFIQLIETASCNRIGVVYQNDVFALIAVMFIEFLF